MCISMEKLKAHSVYVVWLAAMVVFSFLFWFTIAPLLFPLTAKKGKKPSRTYIPEFGLIGFFFWIVFLGAFWCCFKQLTRDKDERGETSHLLPNTDEAVLKQGLNDSVKKRLGLLTPEELVGKSKSSVDDKTEDTKGESNAQEFKVEDASTPEGDKPKKRGLISRLSSMRRNKTESDEPEMKIISLPDFSTENNFKLLMPHEDGCGHCFLCERNSVPFMANVCKDCGTVHNPDNVRLSWNSRKRKDLNIDLGEGTETEEEPTSALSRDTVTPEDVVLEIPEVEESRNEEGSDPIDVEECITETTSGNEPETKNERKSLKKTESLFLLQALHEKKTSKSEIFFVVNDFGHLVNEPEELAELHGLKH